MIDNDTAQEPDALIDFAPVHDTASQIACEATNELKAGPLKNKIASAAELEEIYSIIQTVADRLLKSRTPEQTDAPVHTPHIGWEDSYNENHMPKKPPAAQPEQTAGTVPTKAQINNALLPFRAQLIDFAMDCGPSPTIDPGEVVFALINGKSPSEK